MYGADGTVPDYQLRRYSYHLRDGLRVAPEVIEVRVACRAVGTG
jgi:hypothetical protein